MIAPADVRVFDPPGKSPGDVLADLAAMIHSLSVSGVLVEVSISVLPLRPVRISPQIMPSPRKKPNQKEKILAILAGHPARKGLWIALKLGKKTADGGLRETLSEMVRDGLLVKGPEGNGYMLPTAPMPAAPPPSPSTEVLS